MKRHKLKTCPSLRSQLHTNVFGNLVVAQQTFAEVKEASLFSCEQPSEEELSVDPVVSPKGRRSSMSCLATEPKVRASMLRRQMSDEVVRDRPGARPPTWSAREEREFLQRQWVDSRRGVQLRRRSSAEEEDVSTPSDGTRSTSPVSRRLSDEVIREDPAEEDVWSARVERELGALRKVRKNTYHGGQLSRGSSMEEEAGRRRSTTDLHDGSKRRVSQLVDQLLLDIYGKWGRKTSAGSSAVESDYCSASATSASWCWRTEGYRPGQDGSLRAGVSAKSVPELRAMLATLKIDVHMAGARLVRQLKKKDRLKARQAIQNSVVTAYLQAVSEKRNYRWQQYCFKRLDPKQ